MQVLHTSQQCPALWGRVKISTHKSLKQGYPLFAWPFCASHIDVIYARKLRNNSLPLPTFAIVLFEHHLAVPAASVNVYLVGILSIPKWIGVWSLDFPIQTNTVSKRLFFMSNSTKKIFVWLFQFCQSFSPYLSMLYQK